jgi:hypothetical protein
MCELGKRYLIVLYHLLIYTLHEALGDCHSNECGSDLEKGYLFAACVGC